MKLRAIAAATAVLFGGTAAATASDASRAQVDEAWLTVAEQSDFEATSTYAETLDFLRRLERIFPALRLGSYGHSASGRALPFVVVSSDGAFTPQEAQATGKAIVLIQNGIHGGEIDGKDASAMLLRDLALGRHREILDGAILVVLPIYNVDGHERVSPWNRPNQDGPRRGMGFRTTADGHDLNRDHLKLDTPEARAAIGLFNAWRPHLHVDNHVTDGSDHDWVLTYAWAEAPQLAPPLDAWMVAHMPAVLRETEGAGHRIGPYVDLLDRADPAAGFDSFVGPPRYATGYYPLRHCPSILVENHSYRPYRDRVLANRDFLLALLREVATDPSALRDAVEAARAHTVALGRPAAEPSPLAIAFEAAPPTDRVRWPAYAWSLVPSTVLGVPILRYAREAVREIDVAWRHRPRVAISAARPRGYLVQPGWPAIEARLTGHGLRVLRLESDAELEVETLRLDDATIEDPARTPYQGRTRLRYTVRHGTERRTMPAGTLWIPADQPDFEVAVQLLEPDAPDSLAAWGVLATVVERKEYIESHVLEDWVVARLADDAALRAEWAAALAVEAFAADPAARRLWWYRRSPWWDETVGLMPVFRLPLAPTFAVAPWRGGHGGPTR